MKKFLLFFALLSILFQSNAYAIYDPASVPNNKIGIHILFPDELNESRKLVNSSGGDWGYVTIPVQAGDKDIKKWQGFMDNCRTLHLIPIIRLATEGDYFNKTTWRKPSNDDVVDFANFLSSLKWPTKNKYIIVFNEVNRSDEWQGKADPSIYAQILSYAVTVFKSKSPDFFIISAGLDNAAQNDSTSYNEYAYLQKMNETVPGIFNQIDGFSSHSYPNPGFSKPPSVKTAQSIASFSFEAQTIDPLSNKKLPIFITETGWDQSIISPGTVGAYYKDAIGGVWNDPRIIAITPFLLRSGPGPFQKFSLVNDNGNENEVFNAIMGISKTSGKPNLSSFKKVLGESTPDSDLPVKNFTDEQENEQGKALKQMVKWMIFDL